MNEQAERSYIITTKEKRFALALAGQAGLQLEADQIYGLESGRKKAVLEELAAKFPKAHIHFIEDRLKTLEDLEPLPGWLSAYFARWGYNTDAQRAEAEANPVISCINLTQLALFFQK